MNDGQLAGSDVEELVASRCAEVTACMPRLMKCPVPYVVITTVCDKQKAES